MSAYVIAGYGAGAGVFGGTFGDGFAGCEVGGVAGAVSTASLGCWLRVGTSAGFTGGSSVAGTVGFLTTAGAGAAVTEGGAAGSVTTRVTPTPIARMAKNPTATRAAMTPPLSGDGVSLGVSISTLLCLK